MTTNGLMLSFFHFQGPHNNTQPGHPFSCERRAETCRSMSRRSPTVGNQRASGVRHSHVRTVSPVARWFEVPGGGFRGENGLLAGTSTIDAPVIIPRCRWRPHRGPGGSNPPPFVSSYVAHLRRANCITSHIFCTERRRPHTRRIGPKVSKWKRYQIWTDNSSDHPPILAPIRRTWNTVSNDTGKLEMVRIGPFGRNCIFPVYKISLQEPENT
jgi:hypothetical protein